MRQKHHLNLKNKKVVVAMSGGVDSSVAAALLKKQGYQVIGVFMQFWFPRGEQYGENRCCSIESYQQAREVARILDIPLYKVNFGRQFKKLIVDEFLRGYQFGQTPNPCVNCNKFIKFDLLLKYVRTVFGADYLATGHYARLRREILNPKSQILNKFNPPAGGQNLKKISNIQYPIFKAKDKNKDQSYFLYNLTQAQLKHLLFPLGGYTKKQVRRLAKKFKLPVYDKQDSQEICFVGESHYEFLKKYLKLKVGKIVTPVSSSPCLKGRSKEGSKINFFQGHRPTPFLYQVRDRLLRQGGGEIQYKVLGAHLGLPLYTLGQRSGIKLSGGPWYVAGFDYKNNYLIVTREEKQSGIYQKALICEKVNWVAGEPKLPLKCQAQIRYHAKLADCKVYHDKLPPLNKGGRPSRRRGRGGLKVQFITPQRAIMPGQSVVFYRDDELLGGGIIK